MFKKRLGQSILLGEVSITPVEKIEISVSRHSFGIMFFIDCQPLGIIVDSITGQIAIKVDGTVCDVQELLIDISE